MKEEKTKNILIVILGIVVLVLAIVVVILSVKKEFIDERYDDLEDRYEYLLEHSQNNNSNLGNSNDNDTPDNPNNSNYITRDTALENVLKDLKTDRNNINDLDIELEYKVRYGTTVYEVSFDYKYYEYEYYVDPTTGKILDSFKSLN